MLGCWLNRLRTFVCVVLVAELLGCGTIMYPERSGQRGGRIDAGVAVLDALWLLLFIIPGVVFFIVDFSNGTIYLPGTARGSIDVRSARQVKLDPKHRTLADIERIIERETGHAVRLDARDVRISRVDSLDEVAFPPPSELAVASASL